MKKLFPIIAAISLFSTAVEAHVHSASKPNGSVSTNSRVEKNSNGTTSVDRTTEIELDSTNGSAVTIDRNVEREYDPANKSVSSSKNTEIVSQDGSVTNINHGVEHEYNSMKKTITSNSSTTVYKDGVNKAHSSERKRTVTDPKQTSTTSGTSQPPVK